MNKCVVLTMATTSILFFPLTVSRHQAPSPIDELKQTKLTAPQSDCEESDIDDDIMKSVYDNLWRRKLTSEL